MRLRKPLVTMTAVLFVPLLAGVASVESTSVGRTLTVNGFEMYYEVRGEGEPLVLLHGITGSGSFFEPMVNDFAKEYRVIVPDLRGHGRSTNPSNEFTHRQAAQDVFAFWII